MFLKYLVYCLCLGSNHRGRIGTRKVWGLEMDLLLVSSIFQLSQAHTPLVSDLNLPIAAFPAAIMFFFLHLKTPKRSASETVEYLDIPYVYC